MCVVAQVRYSGDLNLLTFCNTSSIEEKQYSSPKSSTCSVVRSNKAGAPIDGRKLTGQYDDHRRNILQSRYSPSQTCKTHPLPSNFNKTFSTSALKPKPATSTRTPFSPRREPLTMCFKCRNSSVGHGGLTISVITLNIVRLRLEHRGGILDTRDFGVYIRRRNYRPREFLE